METTLPEYRCPNCEAIIEHQYCGQCGQVKRLGKFTIGSILMSFVESIFNFEKGALHTIVNLTYRPAEVVRHYLSGATVKYYTPLKFVFITATLNTLIMLSSGIYDETMIPQMQHQMEGKEAAVAAKLQNYQNFTRDYMSLLSIMQLPIIALTSLIFLRKPKFNYAEHLIYNAYAMAQTNIYQTLIFIILWLMPGVFRDFQSITILSIGMYFLIFYQFSLGLFHHKWYSTLWRSLLTYILSLVLYTLLISVFSIIYTLL